jgi:sarcosine oxidase subunit beta
MENSRDIVVVGAGVIGTATAYYLAKSGLKVTLVDQGDLAAGASGACDAETCSLDHAPGYDANLANMSRGLYHRLIHELMFDIEYRQYGMLVLIETEKEKAFMLDRLEKHMANGLPGRFLEPKDLYKREPLLGPGLLGALESPVDGAVQSMNVCIAFSKTAKERYGLEVRLHERVTDIKLEGGKVAAVVTEKGEIPTGAVVNCAGAWAPFLGKMVGLDIPIKPRKGQLVVIEPTAPLLSTHCFEAFYIVNKFHPELANDPNSVQERYGVAFSHEPTASGTTLIGGSRSFSGYDVSSDMDVVQAILNRATRFIPALEKLHVIRTYCGLRPYCEDHISIISPVEEIPGYYINAGAEGDGIGIAPVAGLLMSQLIQGHEPIVDPTPLSWKRFDKVSQQIS